MAEIRKTKQVFNFTAPTALSVQLVGDFTGWRQAPISLTKGANGVWQTSVELAPGTYHYRFLVDGQWRDDPECVLRVPNPFGSENSVREVPERVVPRRRFAGAGQWRKCRMPVKTIATPRSSAALITSESRTDPPG